MFSCSCSREFKTQKALNAHQISHKNGERYSSSRVKNPTCNCEYCDASFRFNKATRNRFCSQECSALFVWERISVPRIEQGLGGNLHRYLKEKYGDFCSECGQESTWNNKSLTLQLDHIDGNSDNNNVDNVRLLCPNCHTQTETYGNAGLGSRYKKVTKRNAYLQEYKKR